MPQDKKTQVSLAPIKETKTETEIQVPDFTPGGVDPKTGEDTAGIVAPDFESGKVDPKTGNVMADTGESEETSTKEKPTEETPQEDKAPVAPKKPESQGGESLSDAARSAYQRGKQLGGLLAAEGTSGVTGWMQQAGQLPEQAAAAVSAHRKRAELDRQAHEAYQKEFESYQQAMRHHEAKQANQAKQVEEKKEQDEASQRAKDALESLSEESQPDSQWAQPQQPDQAAPSGPSTFEQKMAQQEEQAAIPTPFQAQPQTAAPAGSQKQAESFRQDIKSFPQLSGFTTFIR